MLRAQGRNRDAIAHLGEATALKRDHVAAHVALADMLAAQNELDRCASALRAGARDRSAAGGARHGLANLLRQLGRLDEAAEQFRQVVALRPDYAEAFSNLGVVLAAQGRWADAAEQYQRAISIKPELVDVYRNLARALLVDGRADEALAAIMRGLAMRRDRRSQGDLRPVRTGCGQRSARRGIPRPGRPRTDGRLGPLRRAVAARGVPVHDQRVRPRGGRTRPVRTEQLAPESAADLLAVLSGDRLLRALLESAPVRNAILERFLTVLRSVLLQVATQTEPTAAPDEPTLGFACALARQCFINEYVFAETGNGPRAGRGLA